MDDFLWGQLCGALSAFSGVFFANKSWLMGIISMVGAIAVNHFMH